MSGYKCVSFRRSNDCLDQSSVQCSALRVLDGVSRGSG
jgi:hypothetical protein